ncbi:porin family protein [Hymenobacter armeniacus]|uniref:PorT family protein n=1 Tax=Hymenobacter armeniacus TaxID=2771358 RepID=A0ABR8JPR3_9BACT|nr:porin family protein [Hymenobacter armeniacus]MBD2721055.1 PorT family protein [Hymenobacter armeniacus]
MKKTSTRRPAWAGALALLKMGALLGLGALPLAAQAQDKGPPKVSLKIGGTYAGLAGDDLKQLAGPDYTTRLDSRYLAYHAGAALRIPLSKHGAVALQPELLLNLRGYRLAGERTAGLATGEKQCSFEQTRVLTYVDVPMLANINVGGWFMEFGPQLGFLVHANAETHTTTRYSTGAPDKATSATSTDRGDLTSLDVGIVGGVGYQTRGGLALGLRLNRGLTPLLNPAGAAAKPRAYNDVLMLQVGYVLPFDREW